MKNRANSKKAQRIRKKLRKVNTNRFRLSIHRSNRYMSAQIIDDTSHKTLVHVSSVGKKVNENIKKTDLTNHIAEIFAKRALEKKITKVYLDRGKYKYHGKIKSFAETLRKKGLNF